MAKPETLRRILNEYNIPTDTIEKINAGFDDIADKSSKKKKAQYLFHAMNVIDTELDENTRQKVMESCACTIGSSVEKKTEQFARKTQGLSLQEKVRLLCEVKHLGNPVLQDDGTIFIGYAVENGRTYSCPCPQISGVEITEPMTLTYCMCCVGHFKYQFEKALGVNLEVKQISSALESRGESPCSFVLKVVNTTV